MATDLVPTFVAGTLLAFTLGWGWPGLFNLAVVDSNRETPGSASGISQTGIYVGAGGGPAAFGALYAAAGPQRRVARGGGHRRCSAAAVIWLAARADRRVRALSAH